MKGTSLKYTGNEQSAPLGVAFIRMNQEDGVRNHEVIIYRRVMFSMPSMEAQTMGESIEWQTPELTGTIMRDDSAKHTWKMEATFTTEAQAEAYIKDRLSITKSRGAQ